MEYPDLYPTTLSGQRVVLRELDRSEAGEAYRWGSDEEFVRYLTFDAVKSRADEEQFLRGVQTAALTRPRVQYHLGITWKATSELIGIARLGIRTPEHREGDIGYGVRRDRWGHGIATEAASLLLDLGFGQLGLHRIYAYHHPDNIGSGRVLQKIGMVREGRLRENVFAHGTWRDSILYSILEDEWRGTSRE